ncbi:hypothetical protein, partial [Desulforamulus aquiferis]
GPPSSKHRVYLRLARTSMSGHPFSHPQLREALFPLLRMSLFGIIKTQLYLFQQSEAQNLEKFRAVSDFSSLNFG